VWRPLIGCGSLSSWLVPVRKSLENRCKSLIGLGVIRQRCHWVRACTRASSGAQSLRKILTRVEPRPGLQKKATLEGSARCFRIYSRPVQISRAHDSPFVDNRNQSLHRHSRPRQRSPECSNHLWFQVSQKRPCEERSVDVKHWKMVGEQLGEQLLPNEAVFARTRASRPP
jgi:hypothetical protein